MILNSLDMKNFRFISTQILCLSCCMIAFCILSCEAQKEKSYKALKRDVSYVLELLADRELSAAEKEKAAKEYYSLFDNSCDSLCYEVIEFNLNQVKPMKERPGEPMDLIRRHWYTTTLYYSPTQAGSFIQQLSHEIDPVRVADNKVKRVLKHSDILAALNLKVFLEEGGSPKNKTFSQEEIDAAIQSYKKVYEQGYQSLPYRQTLAAEYWTGILQNWNKLTKEEQELLKSALKTSSDPPKLTPKLYKKWLKLSDEEAADWHGIDTHEYQLARLNKLTEKIIHYRTSVIEFDITWHADW